MEIDNEEFNKALRLLHSKSPDASDELKKILDHHISKKSNQVGLIYCFNHLIIYFFRNLEDCPKKI